jgi:SWI/SNF-related matrix-associated actin-dependent regulator of chromatin subfamily A member 2/4
MEEKGLQEDPRYSQLLAIRANSKQSSLSTPQLEQLRSQIMAYRQLARNQPLNKNLVSLIRGQRPDTPTGQEQQQPGQSPVPPNGQQPGQPPMQPGAQGKPPMGPAGAAVPVDPSKPGQAQPARPNSQPQSPRAGAPAGQQPIGSKNRVTTIAKPQGLDPIIILNERENRMAARIALRMEQLKNLPTNMPEDLRLQAQIELRALRVLNFQRQLRSEIVQCIRRDTTLETAVNVKAYKRTKRQGLREARATEKLEKQQKLEAERKRRQKHQEFLTLVLQHGKDFREYHRNNLAKLGRLNKAIVNYHANAEREQKKEQERIEKERMRRLIAEDEEGYRKLIDQKKDKRLALLLSQTDEYIASVTEMVKQHKMDQQKKKAEQEARRKQMKRDILKNGDFIMIDESCEAVDCRVRVMEPNSGKVLVGDDAPMLRHLYKWLQTHPGWEYCISDDEAEDDEDKNDEKKKSEREWETLGGFEAFADDFRFQNLKARRKKRRLKSSSRRRRSKTTNTRRKRRTTTALPTTSANASRNRLRSW